MTHTRLRALLLALWAVIVGGTIYGYLFHRDVLQTRLGTASDMSAAAGAAVYLAMGCLRGFSLIPATSLVLLGLPFFPPGTLFVLTLAGILVSSASIYQFSGALHLDEIVRVRHGQVLDRIERRLERHGLPLIAAWSFFPLAPTDAICYVAGVLRLGLVRCLVGVGLGEGAISAIYIFGGDQLLRLWKLK